MMIAQTSRPLRPATMMTAQPEQEAGGRELRPIEFDAFKNGRARFGVRTTENSGFSYAAGHNYKPEVEVQPPQPRSALQLACSYNH